MKYTAIIVTDIEVEARDPSEAEDIALEWYDLGLGEIVDVNIYSPVSAVASNHSKP